MQWFYAALTSLCKEWTSFGCTTDNLKLRFSEMCTKLLIVFYVCVKCSLWAVWSDQPRSPFCFLFFFPSLHLQIFFHVCFFWSSHFVTTWSSTASQRTSRVKNRKPKSRHLICYFLIGWLCSLSPPKCSPGHCRRSPKIRISIRCENNHYYTHTSFWPTASARDYFKLLLWWPKNFQCLRDTLVL